MVIMCCFSFYFFFHFYPSFSSLFRLFVTEFPRKHYATDIQSIYPSPLPFVPIFLLFRIIVAHRNRSRSVRYYNTPRQNPHSTPSSHSIHPPPLPPLQAPPPKGEIPPTRISPRNLRPIRNAKNALHRNRREKDNRARSAKHNRPEVSGVRVRGVAQVAKRLMPEVGGRHFCVSVDWYTEAGVN